jgi:hypothetical protein
MPITFMHAGSGARRIGGVLAGLLRSSDTLADTETLLLLRCCGALMSGQNGSAWLVACGLPIAKVAHLLKRADGSDGMVSALAAAASDVRAFPSRVAAYSSFAKHSTDWVSFMWEASVEHLGALQYYPLRSSTHVVQ